MSHFPYSAIDESKASTGGKKKNQDTFIISNKKQPKIPKKEKFQHPKKIKKVTSSSAAKVTSSLTTTNIKITHVYAEFSDGEYNEQISQFITGK